MKQKTNEPKPLAILDGTEIYVLDEGDSMAWNSSTNYDHVMNGASLVVRMTSSPEEKTEYYVNDPKVWGWLESLMRAGLMYIKENPKFDFQEFQKNIKKEYETRKPYVSMHRQSDEG